jgi:ParB-like chromosome segregation protein Spo0J
MSNLRDPFNPKTGEFTDNIRVKGEDDLSELKESLQKFGWITEFPALVDEHDVTLVGHRRLKAAKQLGIDPVIKRLTIGEGDTADAARLALAIASNIGGKPLTREDRIHIAEYLYGQRNWTMEKIGEALAIGTKTVSRYLESFVTTTKPPRPKGGRPKGKRQTKKRTGPTPDVEQKMAEAVLDEGKTLEQVTAEFGLPSVQHAKLAVAREEGRREPKVDRSDLSLTAQQKYDAAIRAYTKNLDGQFHLTVNKRVREFLEATILPQHRKEQEQARQIMRARKGIMDKTSFRLIWSALHPDSRKSISDRKLAEAFDIFSRLEKLLLDEKQSPTDFQKLPQTMADWDRMRATADAARREKRTTAGTLRTR